jgi:hypothetical protein
MKPIKLTLLFIVILLAAALFTFAGNPGITVTGEALLDDVMPPPDLQALSTLIETVKNGQSGLLRGVYISGVLANPVLQQPSADAGYVSTQPDAITQFRMAGQVNSIGLLAHDYLAGASFSNIVKGSEIALVFGDGSLKYYRVFDIQRYQALSPSSPYSNFVDQTTKQVLSAEQLFFRTYGLGGSTLVFQTCISTAQVPSWGRLFILARPIPAGISSPRQTSRVTERSLSGASLSLATKDTALVSR